MLTWICSSIALEKAEVKMIKKSKRKCIYIFGITLQMIVLKGLKITWNQQQHKMCMFSMLGHWFFQILTTKTCFNVWWRSVVMIMLYVTTKKRFHIAPKARQRTTIWHSWSSLIVWVYVLHLANLLCYTHTFLWFSQQLYTYRAARHHWVTSTGEAVQVSLAGERRRLSVGRETQMGSEALSWHPTSHRNTM